MKLVCGFGAAALRITRTQTTLAISMSQCCHNACHKFSKLPNTSRSMGTANVEGPRLWLIANCVTAGSTERKLNLCTRPRSAVSHRINCPWKPGLCLSASVNQTAALFLLRQSTIGN